MIRLFHGGLFRHCVKRVPARACNKVPHCFCIDPRLLWCLVGFRDLGTTPDVQAGFRKGRGTRDQIANICWIIEKAREFQKNIYFCFNDYAKAFVWITINCGKF